ncbi:putative nucleic acid-binding, replication factor A [Helianthus debilis subsp. tardiflorus]
MIQTEDIIGKIFAITATTVTYFNKLQLESTTSTTIDINPPIPDLRTYGNRFQELVPLAEQYASLNHITIADLKKKFYNNTAFYVKCPKCGKRAYPENDRFVCLDDDIEEEAIFMYCLNAKITDNTDTTEVVFYNEALNDIVKVSCRDMVINLGNKNAKVFPDKIPSTKGEPKLLHIAVRNDNSIAVNKAENPRTIQPATPDPKKPATKRALPQLSAISVSPLRLTPAAKERLLAFKKLDPEIRTFQVATQDSQEVSSASATMSSAGKSSKSASKFGIDDLTNVKSSRKKTPASPSASVPKAPVRGKGGKKRKASEVEDLQGLPLLRQQFLDYFNKKFAEIETYVGHVEDQDRQIADLQQVGVLKDLKIADLEKELRATKDDAAKMLIKFNYEKHEITQDAKVSAAIAMYKIQLQMAMEAQDPAFDKSTWDVEGWKARLAELEDDEEA